MLSYFSSVNSVKYTLENFTSNQWSSLSWIMVILHGETKNNKTLHKVAKSILDKAKHSSTRGNEQTWLASVIGKVMTTPSPFVFKCMHGLIDWEFNQMHLRDAHPYNTRYKDNFKMPSMPVGATKTNLSSDTHLECSSNIYKELK